MRGPAVVRGMDELTPSHVADVTRLRCTGLRGPHLDVPAPADNRRQCLYPVGLLSTSRTGTVGTYGDLRDGPCSLSDIDCATKNFLHT
jgi:hypothetical protein